MPDASLVKTVIKHPSHPPFVKPSLQGRIDNGKLFIGPKSLLGMSGPQSSYKECLYTSTHKGGLHNPLICFSPD